MRVAAVDIGTNSVRLLVAGPGAGAARLEPVERRTTITRLGAGVDAAGHLDDAAIERTLTCLSAYAQRWRDLGAGRVRIAATSAVRDAADRDRFLEAVRAATGVECEILSGAQEARTAFLGATAAVRGRAPWLVLDIGGGSTELILGDDARGVDASTSRQLGCVRLTERTLRSDPPTRAELGAARAVAAEELDAAAAELAARSPRRAATLVGVAGTVTTVAALHLGLAEYEPARIHGTRVPLESVRAVTEKLAAMPSLHRAALGPMAPGREDVIVAGCIILEAAMARLGFEDVLVSEADILDGLALELMSS